MIIKVKDGAFLPSEVIEFKKKAHGNAPNESSIFRRAQ